MNLLKGAVLETLKYLKTRIKILYLWLKVARRILRPVYTILYELIQLGVYSDLCIPRWSTADLLYFSLTKSKNIVDRAQVKTVVHNIHFVPKLPKGTTRKTDWRKLLKNVIKPVVIPSATG